MDGVRVHWAACFVFLAAFVAACRVRDGVFHFVVRAAAEAAALWVFALGCHVFKAPAVTALGNWWAVLEGAYRAMAAKCCKGSMAKDRAGGGFVRERKN